MNLKKASQVAEGEEGLKGWDNVLSLAGIKFILTSVFLLFFNTLKIITLNVYMEMIFFLGWSEKMELVI